MPAPLHVVLVVNPRACGGPRAPAARAAIARLRGATSLVAEVETRGEERDAERVLEAVEKTGAEVVAAAGGDGTVGLAVGATLRSGSDADARPALAILPLGTGNNAARSFGLRSIRRSGDGAAALAVDAIARGARRAADVGVVNDRPFLGSFALGIDGDVLARRNRLQRALGRAGPHTGYGLYLASVGLSLAAARRRWRVRLVLDGVATEGPLFNVAVIDAPVYAGPLRFDGSGAGSDPASDGALGVLTVDSAAQYLVEYPRAWVRYLRALRGHDVAPSARLRHAREIVIELEDPAPALVDGEELAPPRAGPHAYRFRVLPRALRVCVPSTGARPHSSTTGIRAASS